MITVKLSDIEKDALKEVANVGAGQATVPFSDMVKSKVLLSISDVDFVSLSNLEKVIDGPKRLVVAIYTPILKDMAGHIVIMFTKDIVLKLANCETLKCPVLGLDLG